MHHARHLSGCFLVFFCLVTGCQPPATVPVVDAPPVVSPIPLHVWQPSTIPTPAKQELVQLLAAEAQHNVGPVLQQWEANAGPQLPAALPNDTVRLAHSVIWAYFAQFVLPHYSRWNRPLTSPRAYTVVPNEFGLAITDSLNQHDTEFDSRSRYLLRQQRPLLPPTAQPVLYLDSARHRALRSFLHDDSSNLEASVKQQEHDHQIRSRLRLLVPHLAIASSLKDNCFTSPWVYSIQLTRSGKFAKVFWRARPRAATPLSVVLGLLLGN